MLNAPVFEVLACGPGAVTQCIYITKQHYAGLTCCLLCAGASARVVCRSIAGSYGDYSIYVGHSESSLMSYFHMSQCDQSGF